MKYYTYTLVLLIVALEGICVANGTEWRPLIGNSLSEHWTTEGNWELHDDGVIHLPDQEYKDWKHYKNYLILKDVLLNDFEIAFDWRVAENSGLYFHIPDLSNLEERKHKEVQLYENSKWTKSAFSDHTAGGIIPGHAPTKNASNPASDWNHMNIRCLSNHITVTINDTIVTEADLSKGQAGDRSTYGGFAFQDHGHAVWLKNIKLRNLDAKTPR